MHLNRFIALAAMALLTACAANSLDKYPFAPQFVSPEQVPPTVLKAPPKPGTKAHTKELNMVINTQKYLTPEQKKDAFKESRVEPEMITLPVLGEAFTAVSYPETYALLRRAGSDAWRISDTAKNYWNTKRPWLVDKRVQLFVEPVYNGSYPSGHTVTNHVWARVLGELMPEKRVELIMRADEIANNRVRGGVHYFGDVHGGIRLADVIYCKMRKSPEFQEAFQRARFELRTKRPYLKETSLKQCA